MQVFKRLGERFKAQNLIEFAFIMPILILLTLAVFEVAFYWQEVNAIYSLNNEINANVALENPSNLNFGQMCPAAITARDILQIKDSQISINDPVYKTEVLDGGEPFALYKISSTSTIKGKPQVALWVDCRNPYEDGVVTQIEFYHKTLVMKASIPRFDKPEPIVIIPDNVFIASPKLNTVRHY